jgi:hypothetical protein
MGASPSQTSINGKPIDPSVLTHNFARIAERVDWKGCKDIRGHLPYHDSPKY